MSTKTINSSSRLVVVVDRRRALGSFDLCAGNTFPTLPLNNDPIDSARVSLANAHLNAVECFIGQSSNSIVREIKFFYR
jgi:hypothetical protein